MKTGDKKTKKKSNLPLIVIAVVVVLAAAFALLWNKGGNSEKVEEASNVTEESSPEVEENTAEEDTDEEEAEEVTEEPAPSRETQVIKEGESLVISTDEVTEKAEFYPIEVDGTQMEVIAIRDSDGNIRTAFNTCQVCYSSGRGYYVQQGDYLVCQNCRNPFTADEVEVKAGGCNPYPIFEENKTVTEDTIEISYDFLKEAVEIFANWKI